MSFLFKGVYHICSQPTDQKVVKWPHLAAREGGKRSPYCGQPRVPLKILAVGKESVVLGDDRQASPPAVPAFHSPDGGPS